MVSQEYGGATNQSHAYIFYTFLSAVTYKLKRVTPYTHTHTKKKSFSSGKKWAREAEVEVAFLYGEERVSVYARKKKKKM